MTGVAGAVIGLTTGAQNNIAPAQALIDGDGVDAAGDPIATSRGCTTNFIGFGKGLSSLEPLPEDFNATDDTVTEANMGGQSFAPTYGTEVNGSKPLTWVDTTP